MVKSNKNKTFTIIYNIFIALLPFLAVYQSILKGVNVAEFFLMVLFIIILFFNYKKTIKFKKIDYYCMALLFYIIIITFISSLIQKYDFFLFHRLLRFIFYCLIIFLSRFYFDNHIFKKTLNIISAIILVTLVLQYLIFYKYNIYIKLYGYFKLFDPSRGLIDYDKIFSYDVFRPSSFLTEPSHISQYLFVPLAINLFEKEKSKKRIFYIIIQTLSIILTKSLWGYVILGVEFIIYWIVQIKRKPSKILISLPVMIFLIFIIINLNFVKDTFSRINLNDLKNSSTFMSRFGAFEILKNQKILNLIFGNGFGNTANLDYCNSITYIIYGVGIFGFLLFIIILLKLYLNSNELYVKTIIIGFSLLTFGSTILMSMNFIIIFSLITNEYKIKDERRV